MKRTKGKLNGCSTLRDTFNYYKTISEKPVTYKEFSACIKELNKEILNQVVNESNTVELPYRLGSLHVVKYDKSYLDNKSNWAIDFQKTKEMGFRVFFNQKYLYKWRWNKQVTNLVNKGKYKFTASRRAKRMVPLALKNKVDYFKK